VCTRGLFVRPFTRTRALASHTDRPTDRPTETDLEHLVQVAEVLAVHEREAAQPRERRQHLPQGGAGTVRVNCRPQADPTQPVSSHESRREGSVRYRYRSVPATTDLPLALPQHGAHDELLEHIGAAGEARHARAVDLLVELAGGGGRGGSVWACVRERCAVQGRRGGWTVVLVCWPCRVCSCPVWQGNRTMHHTRGGQWAGTWHNGLEDGMSSSIKPGGGTRCQ
jgi:hypothetical protein